MQLKKQLLALAACFGLIFGAQASKPEGTDLFVTQMSQLLNQYYEIGNDDEYRQRLKMLGSDIDYQLDPMVKEQIILRVERAKASTSRTLGKADIYFPIFEEYLSKYNVPHQIKYLAIIESNLQPRAKSPAGAGGLWQFIPSTARMYGLNLSTTTDERSDTHLASEAAARLLSELYKYHGDWALAMAAYNCGSGRVNSAIKKAGSKDYWQVRKHLPFETQKYVPYFMAMVYAGEFAHLHEIEAEKQHTELYLTDTIHFDGSATFNQIANQYNVHIDTVRFLNPSYLKNYLPKSNKAHILVLPARAVAAVRGYESQLAYVQSIQSENPIRAVRRVFSEADLEAFAKAFRCSVKDILTWNGISHSHQIKSGDLIAIRKYAASKDLNFQGNRPSTKNQMQQTLSLTTLQVTGLKNNKAVVQHQASKIQPQTAAATTDTDRNRSRNLRGQEGVTTSVAAPQPTAKAEPAKVETKTETKATAPAKAETKPAVAADNSRNRNRNLRSDQPNVTMPIVENPATSSRPAGKATPKSADNFIYHTVEPSQTIWDIKKIYPHISTREILQINRLKSESDIHAGLLLKIPAKD